jgi:hypothetical protein
MRSPTGKTETVKTLTQGIEILEAGEHLRFDTFPEPVAHFLFHYGKGLSLLSELSSRLQLGLSAERTITGRQELPITVRLLNAGDESPEVQAYFGGGKTYSMVVYFGTSPELESTVVLPLWVSGSQPARKVYKLIYEVLRKDRNAILNFEGKYRWRPPHTVHPFWANRIEVSKATDLYDWPWLPFLKCVEECVRPHVFPLAFHRVLFSDGVRRRETQFVHFRCLALQLLERRQEEILALLLPFSTPKSSPLVLGLSGYIETEDKAVLSALPRRGLALALVYRVPDDVRWHVWKITPVSPQDLLGHLLSWALYNSYIHQAGLRAVTSEQMGTLFSHCRKTVEGFCRRSLALGSHFGDASSFITLNLGTFFRVFSSGVYYVPATLPKKDEASVREADSRLQTGDLKDAVIKRLLFIKELRRMVDRRLKLSELLKIGPTHADRELASTST